MKKSSYRNTENKSIAVRSVPINLERAGVSTVVGPTKCIKPLKMLWGVYEQEYGRKTHT